MFLLPPSNNYLFLFCGLTSGAAAVRSATATRRQSRANSLRVMGYGLGPQ